MCIIFVSAMSDIKREDLSLIYIKHHKDQAIPLQAWTGPEGSRRLRLPDFKTIGT
jgi:hypothetical protein